MTSGKFCRYARLPRLLFLAALAAGAAGGPAGTQANPQPVLIVSNRDGSGGFSADISVGGVNGVEVIGDTLRLYYAAGAAGTVLIESQDAEHWTDPTPIQLPPAMQGNSIGVFYHDGWKGNLRPISTNAEHDNTPWMLPDGRVLFTRWEYVARSQFDYHHLWTTQPDGTGQMTYYGNQHPGTAMLDAKPIPGTNRVVASFSPEHDPDTPFDFRAVERADWESLRHDPSQMTNATP